ncbi:MAG TPA: WYL domain-containing protein [Candidatus Gastranaerophilaceae bacterium]|nr:WYL domain-containing protein [Candidatus Gastranaerophilaceae bacterium]HPT40995.1 WYL domain-containing protein [Candidatus Gastranaerophilaceae bacterium]
MIKHKKFSDTSTRVLETLKILVKRDSSIQDIINHFEKIDPNNRIYTNEVILKYINTLKVFGFKFIKNKDKYSLLNPPNQISLSENELKTMCFIEKVAKVFPEEKIKQEVNNFLQNLEKRFDDKTRFTASKMIKPDCTVINLDYEKYAKIIKTYEKYCIDKQKIKILYRQPDEKTISVIVEPIEFKYMENKVYFSVYNPFEGKIQNILLEDIIEITQLPVKSNATSILTTVTFKINGRLAENYKLHEGEKVIQIESDGSKIIVNQKEDKIFLLRRLMRYGKFCEVISPKTFRKQMKETIKETLKNYS